MNDIKIIICGANGKMGQVLAKAAESSEGFVVCAGVDKFPNARQNDFPVFENINECNIAADVIIDFSRPDALKKNLSYATGRKIGIVIATTGFTDDDKLLIAKAADVCAVFFAANMSLGVNLQMNLAKKAAEFLGESYDIEIVEKHHNQKVDAPSGTALAIAERINEAFMNPKDFVYGRHTKTEKRGREIGIHAVRGGTITGEHEVMFVGTDEIIEVNHIAQSKQIFAYGALRAAAYIYDKSPSLYGMDDLIAQNVVSSVNAQDGQAVVTLSGLPFSADIFSTVIQTIADAGINLDIITQTAPIAGKTTMSFSLAQCDISRCDDLLKPFEEKGVTVSLNGMLSKLTVEGAGMLTQSGIASRLFNALAQQGISVYIVTTSDTSISFCVETSNANNAVKASSQAFNI